MSQGSKDRIIQFFGDSMSLTEMKSDSFRWKTIVAFQANDGAIFRFAAKQRTTFYYEIDI